MDKFKKQPSQQIWLCFLVLFAWPTHSQSVKEKLLFSDSFHGRLDERLWRLEIEPVGNSCVYTENGKLILNTAGGVTVWFTKKLNGNIRIEYDWMVLVTGEDNDRLSDLNQFWMATDLRSENLFMRNGKFENYDSLSLYYVGFGGNSNSTTRFRKYQGNGQKPLLKEFTDSAHLLKPNHRYHMVITVQSGRTTFSVDGEVFFEWNDPAPLRDGYFGFRSTAARHAIEDFRVYQY